MLPSEFLLILPLVVAVTVGQTNVGYSYDGRSNVRYQRPQPIYGQRPILLAERPMAMTGSVTAATPAVSATPEAPAVPVPAAPGASVAPSYAPVPHPRRLHYRPSYRPVLLPRPIRPVLPSTAASEPVQPPVIATPQPTVVAIPEPSIIATPQPPVVAAPQPPVTETAPLVPPLKPIIPEPEPEPIPAENLTPKPIPSFLPGEPAVPTVVEPPKPEPVLQTEPIPQPETISQPELVPQPENISQPEPILQPQNIPQLEPTSQPEPVPQPQNIPQPEPVPQPENIPQPEPSPQPVPIAQPQPIPQPKPILQPEPIYPQPEPTPQHEPISQPKPTPHLMQVPEPVPLPERDTMPLSGMPPISLAPIAPRPPAGGLEVATPTDHSSKPVALPPLLPKPKPVRELVFGHHRQSATPPTIYYPTSSHPTPTAATQSPSVVVTTQPHPAVTKPPGHLKFDFQCNEGNGYYSVENECDTYIECKQERATKYLCPDGLHFNPAAKFYEYPCAYPSEVECMTGAVKQNPKPTDVCPNQYGFYSVNDDDCSKFIMCQEGLATVMDCPTGLVFNPKTSTCDWPANVPQCNPNVFKDFTCPDAPEDEDGQISDIIYKYRYGVQCKLYIACQRGHPRLLSCERGLSFDDASQSCIDEDYVTDCAVPY